MIEKRTEIRIEPELSKQAVIDLVDKWRFDLGFAVEEINGEKPWGAYWRFPNWQVAQFINLFFPEMKESLSGGEQNLSPKFLLIAPTEKFSWQYHNRRNENWVVVAGNVGIKTSDNDNEPEKATIYKTGEGVNLKKGLRHRLIGVGEWGLVAEIWTHTEEGSPSDEEDIVRLADDYGREGRIDQSLSV